MSMKIEDNLYILGDMYKKYINQKPTDVELKDWIRKTILEVIDIRTRERELTLVNEEDSGNTVRQHITRSINLSSIDDYIDLIYDWLKSKNIKNQLLSNVNKLDKEDGIVDKANIEDFFNNHKF